MKAPFSQPGTTARSPREHLGTFLLGFFDPAENLLELTFVNLRTHLSVFTKRVADLYLLEGLSQFGDEFVVDPSCTKMREPAQQTCP